MTEVHPVTVVGLDLSLSSTGVAGARSDGEVWSERIQPGKLRGHERMALIDARVREFTHGAYLVVVEGPSFGSTTGSFHERAGLWWMVTHSLWKALVPTAVASPPSVKKYATGKGNATKDQVLWTVAHRFTTLEECGNDEADAVMLAAMGADRLGFPLVRFPAAQRAALAKVAWPDLDLVEQPVPRVIRKAD